MTTPVWRMNACMDLLPPTNVDKVPGYRCRCGHGRADQVGPAQLALPPLEVPVGGRGTALSRLQDIRIHAQTHGASRLTPVKTGLSKDTVEPLRLRLAFDGSRSRNHHGPYGRMNLLSVHHLRGEAQ